MNINIVVEIIASIFIAVGAVFLFLGSLGLFRMPDVFNKLQAGTKATTLGFLSVALGVLIIKPDWYLKTLLIMAFILITNPIGSHALARASKDNDQSKIVGGWIKKTK
jgi:multicomponent Na+:H+ antiporter subunit G